MDWDLVLDVRPGVGQPLYLAIARALADAIRNGRLPENTRLPSSRRLAEALGVQRNTVVAAFDELEAEGWIEGRERQGTFVAVQSVHSPPAAREGTAGQCAYPLDPEPRLAIPEAPAAPFVMSGGLPDLELVPRDAMARAYRRVLRRNSGLLGYGDPAGHPALRREVADLLRRYRGLATRPKEVFITSGAQMALYLVGQLLFRNEAGSDLAVEALGYPPAWAAFRSTGARLHAVPVDEEGIRVEALAQLVDTLEASGRRLRGVYVTPHHQYPTMALMSPSRRLALLALAARHRFAIIEDDYDNEIHYAGQPVLPLASTDRHGSVIYIGTLSKVLAPGLRLGYVVAPEEVVERLARLRRVVDHQGGHIQEAAVAELFGEGELQRHVRRVRKLYAERREALANALERDLGTWVDFRLPAGGLALWVRVADAICPSSWAERALEHGVAFVPGRQLALDDAEPPFVRLGFAAHVPAKIEEAVWRMRAALPLSGS